MTSELQWGILGTGNIAKAFARALPHSETGRVVAVGSRNKGTANKFGKEFGLSRCHGSYEALLADKRVQAVYISLPHPMHAEWAIKTAEAGKHILCEKPIGMNHAEAMAIVEAAHCNDVFLMEAFMYRCHPQIKKLLELIRAQEIGEVRVIQATFSFHADFKIKSRIFDQALGGGGILDVGCYCTSMARLVAGAAQGKDFVDPIEVVGTGYLGKESRVDEWAVASLKFPGGIVAQLATGVSVNQENVVRIFGSEGDILISQPWIPTREGGVTKIILQKKGESQAREIEIKTDGWLYAMEADVVAKNIGRRQAPSPAMSWEDTLGNMRTLDRWRSAIGLSYDLESPTACMQTVSRRALKIRKPNSMLYGKIPGVKIPVSRMVLGSAVATFMPATAVMNDDFFERGGNCFDTAHIYDGGRAEKAMGQWVQNRKIRDRVVILGKGAHTPNCNPEGLSCQLMESLDRLQTDYVDIYMMHRDNLDIPVREFIDCLNEHLRKGRMHAFGGSNWSIARVEAANAYAQSKGLVGFTAVSNNFSLARMVNPVWAGCVSASDAKSRQWFVKNQMALMAWSSQARGFFIRGDPKFVADKELQHSWYSKDNFQRLHRVLELAKKKKILPVTLAASYVLSQPFPTYALIGPQLPSETRTSMDALSIKLTTREMKWLNLETQRM